MLVSALLGGIGSVSVMAQTNVYSLNTVGYVQITLQQGYNIITCPLLTTPDNTLGSVLPNTTSNFDNCVLTLFSPITGVETVTGKNPALPGTGGTGWSPNGSSTSTLLTPGVGFWFYNGQAAPLTITLVGTVTNGLATNTMPAGFNLVGSMVPMSGDLYSNALCGSNGTSGFTNVNTTGDTVYVWDPTPTSIPGVQNGFTNGVYSTISPGLAENGGSPWSKRPGKIGDPIVVYTGEGFYYYNSGATITWVENYTQTQP